VSKRGFFEIYDVSEIKKNAAIQVGFVFLF